MTTSKRGESKAGYNQHMKGVAIGILLMGISLAVVIILYLEIGHIGPTYSTTIMEKQQAELRKQYGLPIQKPIPKNLLEVPPSLRNLTTTTTTTNLSSNNSTDNGMNATAPST